MLGVPWVTQAQSLTDYTLTVDTTTFTSIVTTGTAISLSSTDDGYGTCFLPFPFPFGESVLNANNSICCNSNGFICLTGTSTNTSGSYTNSSQRVINALINQDAHSGRYSGSGVYYQLDTVDGVRCFTIEYHLLGRYSSPYGVYSHQVKLYENGNIQFVYDSVNLGGSTTTMRTFLWDGPENDLAFVTGPWANPIFGGSADTRPNSSLPAHGLRYTFSRPVISCPKPLNIWISNLEPFGLQLNWTYIDTISVSEWDILISSNTDSVLNNTHLQAYADSLLITGLTPGSDYVFSLRAICNVGDSSLPRRISTRTPCVPVLHDSLPYVETFESYSPGMGNPINPCWFTTYVSDNTVTANSYPYVTTIGNTNVLYFYGYSNSTYSYAALPPFEDSLNTLMVSFKLYTEYSSEGSIDLGVMDDPTDISTFHSVATLSPSVSFVWEPFAVPLTRYSGTGYIAFRKNANYSAFLDDVKVDLLPTCAPIRSVTASSVASTSAFVQWEYLDGVVPEEPHTYEIEYYSASESAITLTDTNRYIMLSGLTQSTSYTVRVRCICQDDFGNDSYGSWDSVSFTTSDCNSRSLIELSAQTLGLSATTSDVNPTNGCYEYSYTQQIYDSTSLSNVSRINGISFNVTAPTSTIRNWEVYLGTTTRSSFSSTSNYIPFNTLTHVADTTFSCNTTGWVTVMFDSVYTYTGGNLVVAIADNTGSYYCTPQFAAHSTAGNTAVYYYQDGSAVTPSSPSADNEDISSYRPDIQLLFPCDSSATCFAPNLVAVDVTASEATLVWASGGSETSWDMEYHVQGDSVWTSGGMLTASPYTMTDLTPNTNYVVRLVNDCGDTVVYSVVSFTTVCNPLPLPFTEDFETWPTNMPMSQPNCWNKISIYDPSYPYVSTSYSYGAGSRSLYFYSYATSPSGIVLPKMGASLDSLELIFHMLRTNNSYPHDMVVGVMTDPTDYSTFTAVDTVACNSIYEWEPFAVTFNNYTGTDRYIALLAIGGSSYSYPYIDDISVDYIRECARPSNLSTTNITNTDATLHWTGTADEYEVEYGPYGFAHGTGTLVSSLMDDSLVITGLTHSTRYQAYVRSMCGSDSSSWSFAHSFYTECGMIDSLPFFEDFDHIGTGTSVHAPNCWTGVSTYSTTYPYASTSYSRSGSGSSMYMYLYNSGSYYTMLQLPQVDTTVLPINSLQVEFSLLINTSTYTQGIVVGLCSGPGMTDFVPVDTVVVTADLYTWQDFEVPLNNYHGNGSYITLKAYLGNSSYCYPYLDDVRLVPIPTCLRPDVVYAPNVGGSTAMTRWTLRDSTQTTFEVRYGYQGCDVDTLVGNIVYADSLLLTGLDTGTYYDVYVRAICGPDDTSRWTMGTFRTLVSDPFNNWPYRCDFATPEANSWTLENGTQVNAWYVGSATYNPANSDTMALYVSNSYGADNSYSVTSISHVYAYRTFDMAAGEYSYSFDWKGQGESQYYDFLRVFLVPASNTFTAGSVLGGSTYNFASQAVPADWYDLSQVTTAPYTLALSGSTWNTVSGVVTVPGGTYNMVFVWSNDGSVGTQPPSAVDNVMLRPNTCPAVSDLAAICYTDSLQLSWTPGGTETAWEVTCGTTSAVVYTTNYTLTGLTPATDYTVFVTAICSPTDSSIAVSETFRTPCYPMAVPYSENFDSLPGTTSYSTGIFPTCWNYVLTGTGTYTSGSYLPYVYSSSSYASSGSNSLRIAGNGYFMLPPMSAPLDSLQISFSNYATSTYYGLEVGVMEGGNFVPIESFEDPASVHTPHLVYLDAYHGSSRIIAFRNYYTTSTTIYYSYHYLDDIVVDYIPACRPINNLMAMGTDVTAIVTWGGNSDRYTVTYHPTGSASAATTTTVYGTTTTLTGLTPSTSYTVKVQGYCGSDTTATVTATFTTLANAPVSVYPYLCDFSDSSIYQQWTLDNGTFTNAWHVGRATCNDTADSTSLYISNDGGLSHSYTSSSSQVVYAYCTFLMPAGPYDIMYDWLCYGESSYDYLRVALAPSGADLTAVSTLPNDLSNTNLPAGWIALDGGSALNQNNSWQHVQLDSIMIPNGVYHLVFVWRNDGSVTNLPPAAIDNIQIVSYAAACNQPTITGTTYDYQSITLNWVGSGTEYEVNIKETTATDWPATDIAVTGNTYTFTGLFPATNYTLRVRQNCTADSLGYSDWVYAFVLTDSLPCLSPDSLVVTDLSNVQGTFSWIVNGNETLWDIHVWNTGGLDTVYRVTTNPATVGGFTAGVTYNAAIRPICGTVELEGNYSDTISFTAATCPDVTGLTSSNVTESSVTLNWTADPMAESWQIEYGFAGFAQGTGTSITTNVNTYVVTGLEDESSYDFYVRAICGTDWNSEGWAHVSATTPAASDPTYTVTVTVNDATMGSATGGGTFRAGQSCTVTATPNSGYHFVSWSNGVTDNPYTFTVVANITLTATFAANGTEGIEDVAGDALCTIYPNPTDGVTTISVSGVNGVVRITVVDMNGRTVATETLECNADCEKTMDVANLAQGAYFVKITGERVNLVKKLVVR